jgi:hypothetical protein
MYLFGHLYRFSPCVFLWLLAEIVLLSGHIGTVSVNVVDGALLDVEVLVLLGLAHLLEK